MTSASSSYVQNQSRISCESKSTKDVFNRIGIAGTSKGLTKVLETARKVAKSDSSVLISGESGTARN